MKKEMIITIAKPCSENWDKMTPCEKGRFCGKCEKEVIDFTKMSIDQVVASLTNKLDQNVCGQFKQNQLNNRKKGFYLFLINVFQEAHFKAKIRNSRLAALIFSGFIFMVTACENGNKIITGKPVNQTPRDDIKNNIMNNELDHSEFIKGKISVEPKLLTKPEARK